MGKTDKKRNRIFINKLLDEKRRGTRFYLTSEKSLSDTELFYELNNNYRTIDDIFRWVGRDKDGREVFFRVDVVYQNDVVEYFILPNKERVLLTEKNPSFFSEPETKNNQGKSHSNQNGGNVTKQNSRNQKDRSSNRPTKPTKQMQTMTWYHGEPKCTFKKVNQLNITKVSYDGDFGQGIYLTPQKEVAGFFKGKNGVILTGNWVNMALEELYKDVFINRNYSKYTKDMDVDKENWYFDYDIVGANKSFKVRVFFEANVAWKEALWKGWMEGKRQTGVDMVIGYMSQNPSRTYLEDMIMQYEKAKNNTTDKEILKVMFFEDIGWYKLGDITRNIRTSGCNSSSKVIQLCCYNEDVLNNFL